jgi:hypothetical protein
VRDLPSPASAHKADATFRRVGFGPFQSLVR